MLAKEKQKKWEEMLERNKDSVKEKKRKIVGAVDKVYHKARDWGEKRVELVKDTMKERAQEHQKRVENIERLCLESWRKQQGENASGIQHTHVSNTDSAEGVSMAASSLPNSHEGCTTRYPPAQPPAPTVRSTDCKGSTTPASPTQPSGPDIPEIAAPPAKPSCSITTGPPAQAKGPDMLPLTTPPVHRSDPEASPDACAPVQYADSKCLPVTDPTAISDALLKASDQPQGSESAPCAAPQPQDSTVTALAAQPDASKSNQGTIPPAQQSSCPAQSGPDKAPGNAPSAQTEAPQISPAKKEAFTKLTPCKDYSIFCVQRK
ncbi:protein enabled homolog [Sardina pilchardus]|uniref:protein enabled homolog n=1 Tax=Sardina pilchardus TaxID=27697 RepID=UPI002E0DB339